MNDDQVNDLTGPLSDYVDMWADTGGIALLYRKIDFNLMLLFMKSLLFCSGKTNLILHRCVLG